MSSEKYMIVQGGLLVDMDMVGSEEQYQLFLDATAIGRTDDKFEREEKSRKYLELLDESRIGEYRTVDELRERDLTVQIGYMRRGYGTFGMSAEILWPQVSDEIATEIATIAMRRMAVDLGIYASSSERHINGMVYAHVSREHGITLETNPAASSSMDTDGSEYDPSSERVTLYDHNLYTHEMQLICIAGIIALSKLR